jgi:hypothetical protein
MFACLDNAKTKQLSSGNALAVFVGLFAFAETKRR